MYAPDIKITALLFTALFIILLSSSNLNATASAIPNHKDATSRQCLSLGNISNVASYISTIHYNLPYYALFFSKDFSLKIPMLYGKNLSSQQCPSPSILNPPAMAFLSWTASNAITYPNQYQTLNAVISGGTSPYSYNFLIYNTINFNAIQSWATNNAYPIPVGYHSCSIYNGYIYCIGGYNNTIGYTNKTYAAPITNNTIGIWVSNTPYPIKIYSQSCDIYNGYIYCIGGYTVSGYTSNVFSAQITNNAIGTWTLSSNAYPILISSQSCNIYNSYIYCVGGTSGGSYTNKTYAAPITNNAIGTWIINNAYPLSLWLLSCTTGNNYIYCIGGSGNSGYTNKTYAAPIVNNAIGTWTLNTTYPTRIEAQSCKTNNSYIYCVGGFNGLAVNTVYAAPIINNTINTWTLNAAYPTKISAQSCNIYKNHIYCVGGSSGAYINTVYTSQLAGSSEGSLITNALYTGVLQTSNTFNFQISSAWGLGLFTADINVTDSATASITNTLTFTISQPLLFSLASWTASNAVVDQNQYQTLNAVVFGGTPPYTYNFLVYNPIGGLVANSLYTSMPSSSSTFNFQANSPWGTGIFTANIIITDSAYVPASITNTLIFSLNSIFISNSLTTSNAIIGPGQFQSLVLNISGGTSPYSYNFLVYNAIGSLVSNRLYSGVLLSSNAFAFQIASNWSSGVFTVNAFAVDSASTPVTVSNTIAFRVDPNLHSLLFSPSNSVLDQNQFETLSTQISGGTAPYTYNYIVVNTITGTQLTNALLTTSLTKNSFTFPVSPDWGIGTFTSNVIVKDSSIPTNTVTNTLTYLVNDKLLLTSFLASNSTLNSAQYQRLNATVSGGTAPYTYNFLVYNPSGTLVSNALYTALTSPSNSFLYQHSSSWDTGTFTANLTVQDSASTPNILRSSLVYTVKSNENHGGGGSSGGGGGGGGGSFKPTVITGGNCVRIYNFSQDNSESFSLNGNSFIITENYITPESSGDSVNNQPYELRLGGNTRLLNNPKYYQHLVNISYIPAIHTVIVELCSSFQIANHTNKNTTNNNTTNNTNSGNARFFYLSSLNEQNLTFPNFGTRLSLISSSRIPIFTRLSIEDATLSSPAAPPNASKLLVLNISIIQNLTNVSTKPVIKINLTINYSCNIPSDSIYPYIFQNNTWHRILPLTINANNCSISFSIENDPLIALMTLTPPTNRSTNNSQNHTSNNRTQSNSTPSNHTHNPLQGTPEINIYLIISVVVGLAAIIFFTVFIYTHNKRRQNTLKPLESLELFEKYTSDSVESQPPKQPETSTTEKQESDLENLGESTPTSETSNAQDEYTQSTSTLSQDESSIKESSSSDISSESENSNAKAPSDSSSAESHETSPKTSDKKDDFKFWWLGPTPAKPKDKEEKDNT